jgi:glutamate carboxypeptidase
MPANANVPGQDPVERSLGMPRADAIVRVLHRLKSYVEIETPSRHEQNIAALSRGLEEELDAMGGVVEAFHVPGLGRNLRVTFHGENPELEHMLVLTHIDTVHPIGTLAAQPFRIHGDRAEGPGIFDMKAGLALMVEALGLIAARGSRPRRTVRLLITCDEEIGSHSARTLFRDSAADAGAALVPEPALPDGSVKTRRKGVGTYRIDVHGRAAHAGIEPDRAVSAIAELSHQIQTVLQLADHGRGTTINVGEIGGGTASNVVAARAWAAVDLRFAEPEEGERVDRALVSLTPRLQGARVEVKRNELRPPLVRTAGVVALYEQARALAAELGHELGEGATGGGSDGSLVASFGLPVLDGLGPRGGGAHSSDEHIIVSDLPFRLALFVRLLEEI